jgi:hypothetical protein
MYPSLSISPSGEEDSLDHENPIFPSPTREKIIKQESYITDMQ